MQQLPGWLKQTRTKKSLAEDILSFLQMTVDLSLPLMASMTLDLCTNNCTGIKPLEASIQGEIGDLDISFSGLLMSDSWTIPISYTTPEITFCLPFINICSAISKNISI